MRRGVDSVKTFHLLARIQKANIKTGARSEGKRKRVCEGFVDMKGEFASGKLEKRTKKTYKPDSLRHADALSI